MITGSSGLPIPELPSRLSESEQFSSSQPILKEWAAEHKVKKHEGIGFLGHVVRAIGRLAAIVFAIPAAVILGTYNLAVSLKERYVIKYHPDSVLSSIRQMKSKEENDKFDTMKHVLNDPKFLNLSNLSPLNKARELTKGLTDKLKDLHVRQNQGARLILRSLSSQESFKPQWIDALKDPELTSSLSFSAQGIIPQAFIEIIHGKYPDLKMDVAHIDWKKVGEKVEKNAIPPKQLEKEVQKFERSMENLFSVLEDSSLAADKANPKFIAAFREALASPVYRALKEDASHPSIQLLHRFASDMWNKAPSMDAYREVGSSLAREMGIQSNGQELNGQKIAEYLQESHHKMEKLHYSQHGIGGISYALSHPVQTMGSLASEGGMARHIPGIFNLDVYDSHGTLSNNPSLQGVTTLTWEISPQNNCKVQVNNCYGGSPTIGDHKIAPEFEAVILAAENNQMAPPELRDPAIPMIVNYNNLQNLDKKHGEGARSRTIMLLNQKYPLSFRGTTFAKDSSFYLMHKSKDVVWKNPAQFGDKMMDQLLTSFDPQKKGHGFYFHGSVAEWKPIFEKVIENATAHFEGLAVENSHAYQALSAKDLQGAYQEYVYSMLNAAIEMRSSQTLIERGITDFTVMAVSACKENIDRGGMENTKYLYIRLPATYVNERLPLIMGAMHSRALSARDRAILKSRMPQILNFMKVTDSNVFRSNQMGLFKALNYGVNASHYHPHVNLQQRIVV